jgi:hypothetical protein
MARQAVNVEINRHRKYFVARDKKGRIVGRKAVKGSKFNIGVARRTWDDYGSFTIGRYYKKEYLGSKKTTIRSYHLKKPTLEEKMSPLGTTPELDRYFSQEKTTQKRFSQYQCQGEYKGQHCTATSDRLYYNDSYGKAEAVKEARSRFWRVVANVHKTGLANKTDPDEDLGKQQEDHVINYREGWVSYAPNV